MLKCYWFLYSCVDETWIKRFLHIKMKEILQNIKVFFYSSVLIYLNKWNAKRTRFWIHTWVLGFVWFACTCWGSCDPGGAVGSIGGAGFSLNTSNKAFASRMRQHVSLEQRFYSNRLNFVSVDKLRTIYSTLLPYLLTEHNMYKVHPSVVQSIAVVLMFF